MEGGFFFEYASEAIAFSRLLPLDDARVHVRVIWVASAGSNNT
jgi:hypothetical protein